MPLDEETSAISRFAGAHGSGVVNRASVFMGLFLPFLTLLLWT